MLHAPFISRKRLPEAWWHNGQKSTDRKPLLDALFGKSGLLACDDKASLDAVVDGLHSGMLASAPPEFIRNFERQLLSLYQESVAIGPGFNNWTNTACESENHVLKHAVKWKLKQLPDLINCVRLLVDGQYADADRAIGGLGDFVHQPQNARHRTTGLACQLSNGPKQSRPASGSSQP